MADRVGQQLGNYRLLKLIGRGGFADVYLGEHVRLGNQYAIKVLQTRLASEDVESFQREARTVGRLTHPNIVRVYDFAVEDGAPFLAMDYAPNGTLRQRHGRGAQVPLETVLVYVKQMADALQYAHEQKVIHRDVKPENMLIGPIDDILLSDFGIAVMSQSSRYQTSNEMVGTVGYMAPEQIQGQPRPASDQYALGIVVYEWLCGERPFNGGVTEVATQHLALPPPPLRSKLPNLSPMVEDVVMTALAKDPGQRFGSVRAFATALENAAHAEPSIYSLATQLDAPPVPPPPPDVPAAPANTPALWPTPPGGSGPQISSPSGDFSSASTPFAPTIAGSLPGAGNTWSDAQTIRGSQPMDAQPSGSVPGFPPPPPPNYPYSGSVPVYGGPPMAAPPPPPPSGYYPSMTAVPVVSAPPPQKRRSPVLWVAIALAVLLVGGGGVAALLALTAPHPTISVTSSFSGASLGGPPDTVLHVVGQHFAGNSAITFLLDGSPAPGARQVQSSGDGSFAADVTITDDWTFDTHLLRAEDASGHVTQDSTRITVIPQPVLEVQSKYHDGDTPTGATTTSLTIAGKRFAPGATVTFLLDGQLLPGSQPTLADNRGRVETTVNITTAWTLGDHSITAKDNQGNTTKAGAPVKIVHPGEAQTPGPHGAPTDSATFSIAVTIQATDTGTGEKSTFTLNLTVSNGKVCDNTWDTGQPKTQQLDITDVNSGKQLGTATETVTYTCSGTYKSGQLTYQEHDTSDTYTLSDGGYCVTATPRIHISLKGTFSSASSISGTYSSDRQNINCPRINTFYLTSVNAATGTWTGVA